MITTKEATEKSIVFQILEKHAGFSFKPNKSFYTQVGINQKRFGMICKNKVSPTLDELIAICKYFEVNLSQFIN